MPTTWPMCEDCWREHGQHQAPCDTDCGCHDAALTLDREPEEDADECAYCGASAADRHVCAGYAADLAYEHARLTLLGTPGCSKDCPACQDASPPPGREDETFFLECRDTGLL